jgi:hypothetical protein
MHTIDPIQPDTVTSTTGGRAPRAHRRPTLAVVVTGLAVVAAGGALATAIVADDDGDEARQIDVTSSDAGMDVPVTTVGPGFVRFDVTNESEHEHALAIARLQEGVVSGDIPGLLANPDFSVMLDAVEFFGGVNAVAPGSTFTSTVELVPGDYVLLDYGEGPDGPWFLHDGFVHELEVTDGEPVGAAPDADVQISEIDMGFVIPDRIASHSVWEITNDGDQSHELDLVKLDPGVTPEQALDVLMNGDGEALPGEEVNILGGLAPGRTAYVDVDLEPGEYLAVCFWPDFEHDGAPHFMEGMYAPFVVE